MYVCVCVYIYTHIYKNYTHTHTLCIHTYTYTYTCTCTNIICTHRGNDPGAISGPALLELHLLTRHSRMKNDIFASANGRCFHHSSHRAPLPR